MSHTSCDACSMWEVKMGSLPNVIEIRVDKGLLPYLIHSLVRIPIMIVLDFPLFNSFPIFLLFLHSFQLTVPRLSPNFTTCLLWS